MKDEAKREYNLRRILILMLQGAIIGGGAILPGVSGGVLCVAFGLYMPLMQMLAQPFRELPKQWKRWMFVGFGGVVGLGLCFVGLNALFSRAESFAQCLFFGLIIGTMPSLLREAESIPENGKKAEGHSKYKALAISLLVSMMVMSIIDYLQVTKVYEIAPNLLWYVFCGFSIGMGFVIPGLSTSALLNFLGLYKPLLAAVSGLNIPVIAAVGAGALLAVVLLAKLMNYVFRNYYTVAFYAVIGIVISSSFAMLPKAQDYASGTEMGICVAAQIAGLVISLALDKLLSKYEK